MIRLQEWYISNCDGDWEHSYGFKLETLDNPGWAVTIDLEDTDQERQPFAEQSINEDHESRWLLVRKVEGKLKGVCGPEGLETMLEILAEWLEPRR